MRPENFIIKYLDEAQLMQVATSIADKPWVSTVYYAMDNVHNLYWLSLPDTEHSRQITQNQHVAGAIVLPQTYGQAPNGLQFSGQARVVTNAELPELFEAYAEKYAVHARLAKILNGEDPHCLYILEPTRFVLYDEANFPDSPRQEWVPTS